jgi:hypothetical protein
MLTVMIRPIPFLALTAFLLLSVSGLAQTPGEPCKELQVKAQVQLSAQGTNTGKITLAFPAGETYQDYKLFLFGPKKTNRLDFSAPEITGLSSGRYSLVIENKKDVRYCLKQLTLKL